MSRCSVIPRCVTASVAVGYQDHGRNYLLWRDSHTIVIQVQANWEPLPDDWDELTLKAEKDHQETNYRLEIIQSVLDHNKFGLSNWGYLIPEKGSYRILYRNRSIYRISCRTWAPLVDESEFEITQWVSTYVQLATWRGREVQLFVAYEDEIAKWVEEETKARELLVGLDVSFEVLGHVIRDGVVVGLILEPQAGRPLRQSDRAAAYNNSNVMISTDEKVRFRMTSYIVRFDKKDVEAMAKYQHWEALEGLFLGLATTRSVWIDYKTLGQHAILLPGLPSPERLLSGIRNIFIRLESHNLIPFLDTSQKPFDSLRSREKRRSKRHDPIIRLIASVPDGKRQLCLEDEDKPFGAQDLLSVPRLTTQRHDPFPQMPRQTKLLLASETTDVLNRGSSERSVHVP